MASMWNINSSYNVNSKKIFSKLNFELGQVFIAKMVKVNDNSTVLLRMLDGWQFSAQIPELSEINIEGLTKFSVQGLEEGKLLLKVESDNSNETKKDTDPVVDLINNEELGVNKDDYRLLKDMVKHNLPLSYENISKVKTIIDFIHKTKNSSNLGDEFIDKYMESKNINTAGIEGKILKDNLKDFFGQFKDLNTADILTLLENGVELNERNLKSYNTMFKGNGSLYKCIQNIKVQMSKLNIEPSSASQVNTKVTSNSKEIREILQNENATIVTKGDQQTDVSLKNNEELKSDTVTIIKEQIAVKTEDMKTIIKTLLENTSKDKTESYQKVIEIIKNNISNFKVFNSVSNQYYYSDIPIIKGNYEHRLKLIIKDSRKKGKKIDTSNCKIAASISTETMDIVDAYIKVNNKFMEINIKCFEPFIESIDANKENLLNELAEVGYNVNVNVIKKQQELNLLNCSNFFEDSYFSNIDVKV
jgi:hypothetical protein